MILGSPGSFRWDASWSVSLADFRARTDPCRNLGEGVASSPGSCQGGRGSDAAALTKWSEKVMIRGCHGNVTTRRKYRCLTIESGIRMCEANS